MRRKWMKWLAVGTVAVAAVVSGCARGHAAAEKPDKAAVVPQAASEKPSPSAMTLKTPMDQMSYSVGVETIRNYKKQKMDMNVDAMYKGMQDAMADDKFLMSEEDLTTTYGMFQSLVRASMSRGKVNAARDNKKAGEEFLAANKTMEGVVTLPSGLQYKILKPGTGAKPAESDTVVCYYRGTLVDGTEFDSSARGNDEGEPSVVAISACIPAWREALPMMPVGSKWHLFVPSELAYGKRSAGRYIGPNETLIFDVELVGIK
jgi:FKBP-type peptidyl-prolyl cis-trans isomerase